MKIRGEEVTPKWLASKLEYVLTFSAIPELDKHIEIAKRYGFHALYAPSPLYYDYMYEQLKGTGILIGFPFDYPMGIPGFAGFKSNVTRAAMAADAYEHGCRTADIYPNISAFANKDYKAVVESIKVILDNVGPDFESKIFVDCSGDIDDMYAMVDCIQEAGATHAKAYDKNKYGVPITRIKALRERLTSAGLKASGNGKHWHTLITMGVLAAGADFISATNVPQIVDELPIFEDIFSNVTF